MPCYCFRREDNGELVELVMSVSEMERRCADDYSIILEDGVRATRDVRTEHAGFKNTPGNYPYWSDAMGVHPSQIAKQKAVDARMGFKTEFRHDGAVKITDKTMRRRYLHAHGFHDRNGGYSDPVPD